MSESRGALPAAERFIDTRLNVTTTTDTREGLLLRLNRDEADNYCVSDVVGLRFGYAPSVYGALTEWWAQVSDIIYMKDEQLAQPLLGEVRAYRAALASGTDASSPGGVSRD